MERIRFLKTSMSPVSKKRNSALLVLCLLLMSTLCGCAIEAASSSDSRWISLFNGKNLDGWKVKITGYDLDDNFGNTFRVEDGILKVSYENYDKFDGRFGHIFYDGTFSHYILRVEYRFVGEQCPGGPGWAFRNNGIMAHGQSAESMKKDQDFPDSIEVQMLGGNGTDERSTGNLCTPGLSTARWCWNMNGRNSTTARCFQKAPYHFRPRAIPLNSERWKSCYWKNNSATERNLR